MLLFGTEPDLIRASDRQHLQYLESPGVGRVDHQRRTKAVIGGMDAFALSAAAIGAGTDIAAAIRANKPVDGGSWCETASVRTIKLTSPWNELTATRCTLPWFALARGRPMIFRQRPVPFAPQCSKRGGFV
jgi:hypothetical protein